MPLVRRRPLLRAAVVGGAIGTAHHAGKLSAENAALREQQPQPGYAPPPQAPPPQAAPAPSEGISPAALEQLKELGQLHEQKVLTDEEFEQQKRKLLGSVG
jgi:Short C-terminal domain